MDKNVSIKVYASLLQKYTRNDFALGTDLKEYDCRTVLERSVFFFSLRFIEKVYDIELLFEEFDRINYANNVGRPAKLFIHDLWADTECHLEDLRVLWLI